MSDYESEDDSEPDSSVKKIDEVEEDEFELQLRQEALEKERESAGHGKTRTDEDGTVMEWDAGKRAWFPMIDNDFIAQYQMNYGVPTQQEDSTEAKEETSTVATTNQSYQDWFQECYKQAGNNSYVASLAAAAAKEALKNEESDGDTLAYYEYYDYYYKYYQNALKENSDSSIAEANDGASTDYTTKMYEDFYAYWGLHGKSLIGADENGDEQKAYADAWTKFSDNYENAAENKNKSEEPPEKKKKDDKPQTWFDLEDSNNFNVYVSGMPEDVTEDEFHQLMSRCGMVLNDIRNNKPKIKLYKNSDGSFKGDGLCCYCKKESVKLAIDMLDEYDVRGYKISVVNAKFELKGKYNPKKRGKSLSNKEKKKQKEKQEKLFDWRPDQTYVRKKHEKTVIIKNLFKVEDFEKNPPLLITMKADLENECNKYGLVKKVVIHDNHKDGVSSVTYSTPEEADLAKSSLDGRLFKGKSISVETYDGVTKYSIEESEEQKKQRLAKWQNFLVTTDNSSEVITDNDSLNSECIPQSSKSTNSDELLKSNEISDDNIPDVITDNASLNSECIPQSSKTTNSDELLKSNEISDDNISDVT